MEMTAIYIYGTIGALLCLIVGAMLGYVRREKQQEGWAADSRDAFNKERAAIHKMHQTDLQQERNVVRELEIALLQAGEEIERCQQQVEQAQKNWKFADKFREALVVALIQNNLWGFDVHSNNPLRMIAHLVNAQKAEALDPSVSQKAKNLYVKGVRAGAKKGRAQMQKLMQKSIDNQAGTIEYYTEAVHHATARVEIYREAVTNVLTDKVALPGVRKAISSSIAEEVSRLYLVKSKKGA